MDCSCRTGGSRCPGSDGQQVTTNVLVFLRDELLSDIENYAFVTGDIMPGDDEHMKHQVFDVTQDGNEDLVSRMLGLAHAECVDILYPYTKDECMDEEVFDDELHRPEMYAIELSLPGDFSRTTVLLLKGLVHDYFVCRVLAEWLGITCPSAQPFWKERLELLTESMKGAVTRRRKPLRRRMSIF